MTRRLAKNGVFHIARIAAFLWRKNDKWKQPAKLFKAQIDLMETTPDKLNPFFKQGLDIFKKIVLKNEQYASDTDRAMKSYNLDTDIDKYLYTYQLRKKKAGARR